MTYLMYQDRQHAWRWRLFAANNRIIADSAEGYNNKQDCRSAIDWVKGSGGAPVMEQ